MKNEMKKNLLDLSNRFARRGAFHSRRGNMVRAWFCSKLELGLLELRWQLSK